MLLWDSEKGAPMGGKTVAILAESCLKWTVRTLGFIALFLTVGCSWCPQTQTETQPQAQSQAGNSGDEAVETDLPSRSVAPPVTEKPSPRASIEKSRTIDDRSDREQWENTAAEVASKGSITSPESPMAKPAPLPPAETEPMPAADASTPPEKREGIAEKPVEEQPAPAQQLEAEQAAPLDLELLEKRLRETDAIGFFTKIALKNQVNDLLDQFRAFYEGRSNSSLTQLRQPYDLLIMKVLALLQDSDPPLARDLLKSREAIWKILADREEFTSL